MFRNSRKEKINSLDSELKKVDREIAKYQLYLSRLNEYSSKTPEILKNTLPTSEVLELEIKRDDEALKRYQDRLDDATEHYLSRIVEVLRNKKKRVRRMYLIERGKLVLSLGVKAVANHMDEQT